jgi:hypothetical protein
VTSDFLRRQAVACGIEQAQADFGDNQDVLSVGTGCFMRCGTACLAVCWFGAVMVGSGEKPGITFVL